MGRQRAQRRGMVPNPAFEPLLSELCAGNYVELNLGMETRPVRPRDFGKRNPLRSVGIPQRDPLRRMQNAGAVVKARGQQRADGEGAVRDLVNHPLRRTQMLDRHWWA